MDSKSTAKLVKTRVCQHLELSTQDDLELHSRHPSSSSASSSSSSSNRQPLAECKLRAKEFAEQDATVLTTPHNNVAPLRSTSSRLDKVMQQLGQLLARVDGRDRQIRELQAAISEQQAAIREQQAAIRELQAAYSARDSQIRELQAGNSELRGRVDVLASQSAAHRVVLLRHVVDLAHKKLEERFDSDEDRRPQDMQFSVWLASLQGSHPQYFEQHHLDAPALQLLHKGRGTPFHAGDLAAHQPPQAHVDPALADAALEQPAAWNTLWAFVTSPER
ncbi:hypothetical protein HYH02_014237 [Chlamydomonas schloesseri]|uniref:Uncharacterized protein n=1 Tax=Chlamydomonas schloesseri TaxID=2026947 RepID=A0A835SYJ3_9CHLO|nr:hypothetical protein HYH02_014237 [Chlamydomonas schloesseri]|eukprot:KAG2428825.1 hypothetical protein HYH02_014237 [Chlamydomonas schloesseri]